MKGERNAYLENIGWMITNSEDSSKSNKFVWDSHQKCIYDLRFSKTLNSAFSIYRILSNYAYGIENNAHINFLTLKKF